MKRKLLTVACFIAVTSLCCIATVALAQDRRITYTEASVQWTEMNVARLSDGGVAVKALCSVGTGVDRQIVESRAHDIAGPPRAALLLLGEGAGHRACKKDFRMGDGGLP